MRQGEAEAEVERKVTAEQIRQIDRDEQLTRSATIASIAGSNIKVGSGSQLDVLAEQAAEFARERQFTEEVGASNANVALQRAKAIGEQARFSSYTTALGAFGSAAADPNIINLFAKRKPS